ncbi:MAG TPA: hypothetical protein VKX49_09745 [Bryobacteraceae bacterium]|nr:hypothetical protein [Bryobacteraceae bacterium]
MSQFMSWHGQNVAAVASRVLFAYKYRPTRRLREEVAHARRFFHKTQGLDELETERLDVLRGAIESLDGPRPEQVRAAIHLLEHLAHQSA